MMVMKYILIVLLLFSVVKSSENTDFCQEMVVKECSPDLGDIFQAAEERIEPAVDQKFEKCTELQEAVDCLSVPRCSGDLLYSFRSLVFTTAYLLRANNLCPRLKFSDLKRYIADKSMPCSGTTEIYDNCNQKCTCYKGELLFCRRIRKDFTAMNIEERQRFVIALRTAATNPIYRDRYRNLGKLHSRMPSQLLHHMPQVFLPWHRWYLMEFEDFLRRIDCRITIPFWDWSKDAEQWAQATDEGDVWNAGLHGLGGDGVLPHECVKDGPFQEGEFFIPETIGQSCLKRNFNRSCFLPGKEQVQKIIDSENFNEFESFTRKVIHPAFHDCVGGHMAKHHSAAFTPEFWIHHSFVDKLWADWQMRSSNRTFQYFPSIPFEMPLTGRFPWELLDNQGLPGEVRVSYED